MVELYKVKESDNQIEYKYLPENKQWIWPSNSK